MKPTCSPSNISFKIKEKTAIPILKLIIAYFIHDGESFVGERDVGNWRCLNLSDFHGIDAMQVTNFDSAAVRGTLIKQ